MFFQRSVLPAMLSLECRNYSFPLV